MHAGRAYCFVAASGQDRFLIRQRFWEAGGGSCPTTPPPQWLFWPGNTCTRLTWGSIPTATSCKPKTDGPEDGKDGCCRMQSSSSLPGSDVNHESTNNYSFKSALAWEKVKDGKKIAMRGVGPWTAWCQNKVGISAPWPRGSKTVVGFHKMHWSILHCVWIFSGLGSKQSDESTEVKGRFFFFFPFSSKEGKGFSCLTCTCHVIVPPDGMS